MNRDPGRGRGRGRDLGRSRGRGRGRDRGGGPWRSPGGGAHWVPKGRSSDHSSHSSYSVGPDESSSGEKPFSNRDRNSQPNSRRCFPSYPNSAGNIFCQEEPLENKSLEDSMSSTGRMLHDQSAPSCSSLGSNQSDCSVASNSVNKGDSALMPAISGSRDMKSDIVSAPLEKGAKDGAVHRDFSRKLNSTVPLQNQNESHLSFQEKDPNNVVSAGDSGCSEQQAVVEPCDVCLPKTGTTPKLKPDCSVASNSVNKDDSALMPAISGSRSMNSDIVSAPLEKGAKDGAMHRDFSLKLNSTVPLQNQNESHLSFEAGANDQLSQEKDPNIVVSAGDSGCSEQQAEVEPFDICLPKTGTTPKLKPSLLVKNREKRNDVRRAADGVTGRILRSGMVLLKNYLSLHDQIKIIKLCRDIGLGPGGFYQPVYRDGGRMHLKMMSLGKSWDPDRGKYVEHRPFDGAKAPIFPSVFHPLVERAIKDSHALIEINSKSTAAEDILPSMSPNICVVNFYSESGRLGLHQDKDESPESLRTGLPVVSFSIGDIGEFLYGDQRDVEKAEKVKLESGDVLIFGGVSRHIFHGVSSVQPKTAPAALLDETNLRPGRLNLTFREY
uniref:DNA N(6)-methyladenine demethylase n=1 Tax=Populus davidiana TaxID=266767 RepID=A0A6M2EBN3_9ROSI